MSSPDLPIFEGWRLPSLPEDVTPLYAQLGLDQTVALINDGYSAESVTLMHDGPSAQVYRLEHDLATLVLRLATPTPLRQDGLTAPDWTEGRIRALEAGRGRGVFEQLVTYSLADEATVTLFAPGTTLAELPTSDVEAITDGTLEVAVEGIAAATEEAEIELDGGASNFLYDRSKGFTVVDYGLGEGRRPVTAATALTDFLGTIASDTTELPSSPSHSMAWLQVFDRSLRLVRQHGIDPYRVNPNLQRWREQLQDRAQQ